MEQKPWIIEVKSVIGNAVENKDGVANVRFINAHGDKLTYSAPSNGEYVSAYAVMATDAKDAMQQFLSKGADHD